MFKYFMKEGVKTRRTKKNKLKKMNKIKLKNKENNNREQGEKVYRSEIPTVHYLLLFCSSCLPKAFD